MPKPISREAWRGLSGLSGGIAVATVLFATFGAIVFGTAVRASCIERTGAGERPSEFRWCSSQFPELYVAESLSGDRLPYLDECTRVGPNPCDEYPVLTMYAMRLTGWLSDGLVSFFYWNVALMLVCASVAAYLLAKRVGMRALYFALAPTLVLYGLMNWDLVGVVFMVIGVEAFLRGRATSAGVALGLSAAVKLFPGLLVVPLAAELVRRKQRGEAFRLALAAAGAWFVVNVPFAALAPEGWSLFFRFNSERPADIDSLWYTACHRIVGDAACVPTPIVNVASFVLFVAGATVVWRAKRRREPEFERWTFAFPLLVVFLLANKVYSPQYSLFLLPWFALVLPNLRLFAAFTVADIVIFLTRYEIPLEPPLLSFQLATLARDAILIAYVVAWIRQPAGIPMPSGDQDSSWAASASGSVTGSLQVKRSQT